ncbi:MAG: endonuclease domain-containing protein [Leptolyngbyaceae cyanobacterium bins.59]|nr:endonuclease domain-containing protein [Leptolyngbyaceae cyanobacterium bins.59]
MQYRILPYEPHLKDLARKLRRTMTRGETILWNHLKAKKMHGYDFDRQRPIDRFIVDFYGKELMLAIEIDGLSHASEEAQQKDEERQARLEALGVSFLRFHEEDVCKRTEEVVAEIEAWIVSMQVQQSP